MPDIMTHEAFMQEALRQAEMARSLGEVPVGAVVVFENEIVAAAHNLRERDQDPTAHAELIAIKLASEKLGSWRLNDCTVYVTLEPCAMCAGAMVLSRIGRCVFGATDPRGGFLGTLGDLSSHPVLNHRFDVVSGVLAQESSDQLKGFFREKRQSQKKRRSGKDEE
jgi:tRNA(adenine34) deaminase